jgi:uncharacterized membrane protein HdeD (DUF308 family)
MATSKAPIRWVSTVLGVLALVDGIVSLASGAIVRPPAWRAVATGALLVVLGVILLRVGRGARTVPCRPRW